MRENTNMHAYATVKIFCDRRRRIIEDALYVRVASFCD